MNYFFTKIIKATLTIITTMSLTSTIVFGSFTLDECRQLIKNSSIRISQKIITFGSFTQEEAEELIDNSTITIPYKPHIRRNSQDFKPIIMEFPDKDAVICKRCYRREHVAYDCFSKKTITGIVLPYRGPRIVIHMRHEIRHQNRIKKEAELKAKETRNIKTLADCEMDAALEYLYWVTSDHVLHHAQTYVENNLALYGTY